MYLIYRCLSCGHERRWGSVNSRDLYPNELTHDPHLLCENIHCSRFNKLTKHAFYRYAA